MVLSKTLEKVGRKGEVVEVKDGYARNYLIPGGLAMLADDPGAKGLMMQAAEEKQKENEGEERSALEAKKLEGKTVVIKAKVGEKKQLFASITPEQIKKAIEEQLSGEAEKVEGEAIKDLGEYEVKVKFGFGQEATVKVKVEAITDKK